MGVEGLQQRWATVSSILRRKPFFAFSSVLHFTGACLSSLSILGPLATWGKTKSILSTNRSMDRSIIDETWCSKRPATLFEASYIARFEPL